MFYLGLRSSDRYLAALASCRSGSSPHDIVTVAGGLAFLHAISASTRSLTIIDQDPETLSHWFLIRALIVESTSIDDFLSLLTGYAVSDRSEGSAVLGDAVDVRTRLANVLSSTEFATWDRTYGALNVDPVTGIGTHAGDTVRFFGMDFREHHFNWRFGEGNLTDDGTFQVMRRQIQSMPVCVEQTRLELLDYDTVFPPAEPGRDRVFLASNCESPLFTEADAIFLRVIETATAPVRYISWHRDARVGQGEVLSFAPAYDSLDAIVPSRVFMLAADRWSFPLLRRRCRKVARTLADLRAEPEYGRRLLVIAGHTAMEVATILAAVAPAFLDVVWVPARGAVGSVPDVFLPNYHQAQQVVFHGRAGWRFELQGRTGR